jgi:hypothetical protein
MRIVYSNNANDSLPLYWVYGTSAELSIYLRDHFYVFTTTDCYWRRIA